MPSPAQQAYDALHRQWETLMGELSNYSGEQLSYQPEPGKWSIKQVLGHLYFAENGSAGYMEKKLSDPSRLKPAGLKARLRKGLLNVALKLPIKWKAPKVLPDPSNEVPFEKLKNYWTATHKRFQSIVLDTPPELLTKEIFKHPLAGKMNAAQAFTFMQEHVQHHLAQIERIKASKGFPS